MQRQHMSYGQHGDPFYASYQASQHQPTMYDAYFTQSLQAFMSYPVVIQTPRGSIRGLLAQVYPDHIVLQVSDHHYFIRTQEIIWVLPQHIHLEPKYREHGNA